MNELMEFLSKKYKHVKGIFVYIFPLSSSLSLLVLFSLQLLQITGKDTKMETNHHNITKT